MRTLYYDRLCESLSSEESFLSFISNSYDLSISLLCLVSNDKLSKLKGIFLNPSDKLFGLILSFIEKMVKNNMEYNPLPKLITLFQYPLKTQKILLSGFGRATIKTILQEIIWNKRPLKNDIFSILKGLKEKEILPQNKGTLIFWRHIQDLLFEISEDHVLSNTQQIELGQELSKMALKVYFISGDAREDAKYLEKYVMFLADSVVRWLDQCSNLLNFHFLTTLVYKPMLEQSYVRKLLEFIKLERRKKEEELEKNGKKLDKMENYHYFERFIVLIEKLSKENKGKEKKEKKNNLEEEREDIDLESKRKEIQNELEEKRKEVVDFEKEEEGTTEVLEYNKEEKIKKRTPRKKIK